MMPRFGSSVLRGTRTLACTTRIVHQHDASPSARAPEALRRALRKWQHERGATPPVKNASADAAASARTGHAPSPACERIVVLSKRDLVGDWGIEPFRRAMWAKYPDQKLFFVASNAQGDVKALHRSLIDFSKRNLNAPETNVLVVGMPNVGKSTLLNALRSAGASGPVAKALQTSAQPGMTRSVSTTLRSSTDPLVILAFLARGEKAQRLGGASSVDTYLLVDTHTRSYLMIYPLDIAAVPAGIKQGPYNFESLARYLAITLDILNP